MSDRATPATHARPDGEAELTLVARLPWEDVARLGREAGRLASRMRRPVTPDETVSRRPRSVRGAVHAKPAAQAPDAGAAGASVASLPSRPPAEQARQAIERTNGTA